MGEGEGDSEGTLVFYYSTLRPSLSLPSSLCCCFSLAELKMEKERQQKINQRQSRITALLTSARDLRLSSSTKFVKRSHDIPAFLLVPTISHIMTLFPLQITQTVNRYTMSPFDEPNQENLTHDPTKDTTSPKSKTENGEPKPSSPTMNDFDNFIAFRTNHEAQPMSPPSHTLLPPLNNLETGLETPLESKYVSPISNYTNR
jgi:hypothetical protein